MHVIIQYMCDRRPCTNIFISFHKWISSLHSYSAPLRHPDCLDPLATDLYNHIIYFVRFLFLIFFFAQAKPCEPKCAVICLLFNSFNCFFVATQINDAFINNVKYESSPQHQHFQFQHLLCSLLLQIFPLQSFLNVHSTNRGKYLDINMLW